jgi:uncharacterized protein (TIGR02246 family)
VTSTRPHPVAFIGLLAASVLAVAGCGSNTSDRTYVEAPAAPARATASHEPTRPTIRPIPDVITKPKPFRLPDTIGNVPSLEPITMAPVVAAAKNAVGLPNVPVAPLPPVGDIGQPAVAEVTAMMRAYLQAFNRHDSAALAAHWSETGENIDLDSGETTRGREAVERVFSSLFEEDASASIDIDIESIRPLRDDVVVVDGVTQMSFSDPLGTADDGAAADKRAGSRFSAVVVKENGRWMLESVRETAAPSPGAPSRGLDELEWLVGSWEDIGEGVTAGTQCFWAAGRGFLVRSHVVSFDPVGANRPESGDTSIPGLLPPGTGTSREITEVIGWDPELHQIRSWLFTSDGRFAEGWWTHDGDRWTVRVEGRGADESAACTFTIERAGPDELSIRCASDSLSHVMPPACEFVRTARLGTSR